MKMNSLKLASNSLIKELNIPIGLIPIHIHNIVPIDLFQKRMSISRESLSSLMYRELVFRSFLG